MEVRRSRNGKRLWSLEQKKAILLELEQGYTAAEVARKHDLQMQHIYRWRHRFRKGGEAALRSNQEMVPLSEVKRLETEKKQLQQALGEMTLERNILRDTVEVARGKKWILDGR